jgi:hypothetical protein
VVMHDHGISQNGRKAQQNGPVAYLTERKKHKTHTISYQRAIIRKATPYLAKKLTLATPRPEGFSIRAAYPQPESLWKLSERLRAKELPAENGTR